MWENNQKYYLKGNDWKNKVSYAPEIIQEKAIEFIKENNNKSFFLYYAASLPHAELISPNDSIFQLFENQFEETPYVGSGPVGEPGAAYGPGLSIPMYAPCENPRATFASMIYRLDSYVGEINSLLDSLGISDNTMIVFTSDNGPHQEGGADPVFFNSNGGLNGYKRDLYEGGIRVPMIVQWPNKIAAGRITDHISAFWDILPTFCDLAKIDSIPENDGISFLPTLLNKGEEQRKHDHLYWEFHELGGRQAVLKNGWKYVKYEIFDPDQTTSMLFNLEEDPGESKNLSEAHPELIAEFERILKKEHIESELFPFPVR